MKFAIVVSVVALLLGLILSIFPKSHGANLSERCARVLVTMAESVPTKASVSYSGSEISVGSRHVGLIARVENRKRAEKKFLVALAVDLFVDGVFQPLTVGSVGVGDTEEEAENTAIEEWAQYVGMALFASLVFDDDAGLPFDVFVAYGGLTGIRGSQFPLPEHLVTDLLGYLKTMVPNLRSSGGELHSILIMVYVEDGRVVGGECRVDGVDSTEALAAIRPFPWPPTQAPYLFKQFYILRRK
jgi:hypothetical protein